jgi:hypothetical protein
MYTRLTTATATSWNQVEDDFLVAMSAFDAGLPAAFDGDDQTKQRQSKELSAALQNGKGDWFNNVIAYLLERCASLETLYVRRSVPGLIIPEHNLDGVYPGDASRQVEFLLEAKMMGTPKHANSPGEKAVGRAGSADTNKRVKELAFKSIDLKGEASRRLAMIGTAPTEISRVGLVDLDVVLPPVAVSTTLAGISSLTLAAGMLWTSVEAPYAKFASISLSTGIVTAFDAGEFFYSDPWLVSSPTDPSVFFAVETDISAENVYSVTVSNGVPTMPTALRGGQAVQDLAVTSNGKYLVVGSDQFLLDATTSPHTVVNLPGYGPGVATSPGQGGIFATAATSCVGDNLSVYSLGSTTPFFEANTQRFDDPYCPEVLAHGLVITPSGSYALALSSDGYPDPLLFQALRGPQPRLSGSGRQRGRGEFQRPLARRTYRPAVAYQRRHG